MAHFSKALGTKYMCVAWSHCNVGQSDNKNLGACCRRKEIQEVLGTNEVPLSLTVFPR